MTHTRTFTYHAIPAEVVDGIRAGARDASGNSPARWTAEGGEPVRCCLSDAQPGEELLLFGYVPDIPATSPYREVGAVFVHAQPCASPAPTDRYPADWYGRAQVLRAYDERGWIHPATRTHDGSDPEAAIADVLAEPGVVQVHSRNIAYGCYMMAITA